MLISRQNPTRNRASDRTVLVPLNFELVPFAGKKAASITAVRHAPPPPDQEEQLRKIALAKVNAAKGTGHRHGMYSLMIEDAKPEKRRLFATNEEFFSTG